MSATTSGDRLERSQLLTMRQVSDLLGVSRWTVNRYADDVPGFPKPIRLTPKTPRWRAGELLDWLDGQHDAGLAPLRSPKMPKAVSR